MAGGYALCGVLRSKYAVSAQWLQQSLEGFYFSYQYDMEFHIFFSYDIITKIEDDDKLNITDSLKKEDTSYYCLVNYKKKHTARHTCVSK